MEKKGKKDREKKVTVGAVNKNVGARGRTFTGNVVKKFGQRAVVEFKRTVRVPKYERFTIKKTKLHARIPESMEIHIGDSVKIRECRPLSKIVHFIVIEKLNGEKKE